MVYWNRLVNLEIFFCKENCKKSGNPPYTTTTIRPDGGGPGYTRKADQCLRVPSYRNGQSGKLPPKDTPAGAPKGGRFK